jgi:hypothetical protein
MEATCAMGHLREAEIVHQGNHRYVIFLFFFWVEEREIWENLGESYLYVGFVEK